MEETLLDSLEKSDPPSCVELTYQYRMNEEIMRLSNKLIYSNKLRCGNNQIQSNTISQHCDETVSAARFGLILDCVPLCSIYVQTEMLLDCQAWSW